MVALLFHNGIYRMCGFNGSSPQYESPIIVPKITTDRQYLSTREVIIRMALLINPSYNHFLLIVLDA